jgi:hypothetical protein
MRDKYEVTHDLKKIAYQKIHQIKQNYSQLLQVVKTKKLPFNLVQYEPNWESSESNLQFNNSLQKNISLLVGKIVELQNHNCPRICSETYHQKIKLEQENKTISQIITKLELELDRNSNLTQLISKIKELIAKPDNLEIIIQIDSEYLNQK